MREAAKETGLLYAEPESIDASPETSPSQDRLTDDVDQKSGTWTSTLLTVPLKIATLVGISTESPTEDISECPGEAGSVISHDPGLPHIEYTYELPGKVVLSCTVWYAVDFDDLRRRCGIEQTFVQSLAETVCVNMDGGKTTAGWWRTKDQRFVVKELRSKWNVSDTLALLEMAPGYFRHMREHADKPSAMAKIMGFFTGEYNQSPSRPGNMLMTAQ